MPQDLTPEQQRLEALLDGLALLSRIYWGPDPELCQELANLPGSGLAEDLAPLLDEAGAASLRAMAANVEGRDSVRELCDEMEQAYVRLFVSHPEGLAAPLYHSCYVGQGLVMGPPAGVMAQRLEEAGLALSEKEGEPPDHLSVELEYLIFLLEESADGSPELVDQARDMAGQFMLPWLREFSGRLQGESDCPLYYQAARLMLSLLDGLAHGNQ